MYRLCMNRCGSHAQPGALGHNFNEMSFRIEPGRCFRESFDGQPKLLQNASSSPEGCDDA
jgi:hypothetical protein